MTSDHQEYNNITRQHRSLITSPMQQAREVATPSLRRGLYIALTPASYSESWTQARGLCSAGPAEWKIHQSIHPSVRVARLFLAWSFAHPFHSLNLHQSLFTMLKPWKDFVQRAKERKDTERASDCLYQLMEIQSTKNSNHEQKGAQNPKRWNLRPAFLALFERNRLFYCTILRLYTLW